MLAIFICVAVLLFSPTFGAPKGGQLIAPRDCQVVFPIPRAAPSTSTPSYPIQFTIPYNDSSGSSSSTSSGFSSGSSSILDSLGSVSVGGSSGSLGSLGSSTGFSSTRGSSGAGGAPNRRQASSSSAPVADPLEIGFAIPSGTANSGKGPCSLVLDLTSPDAKLTGASLPATVNVVALDGPSSGSVIGTVQFAAGAKATVNSFSCRDGEMCYRLEVTGGATGTAGGSGGSGGGGGGGGGGVVRMRRRTGEQRGTGAVQYLQGAVVGMGLSMNFGC